jgi:hypothetical protein
VDEAATRSELRRMAEAAYGAQRAAELETRLGEIARWLRLIDEQPLDLLDEEPDHAEP